MKNTLIIILLILLYSCQEEKKTGIVSEIRLVKNEKIQKKNEVFIKVNDTIDSFFINLFVDEMQDKPDMLYFGEKYKKTSIIIPTDKSIRIIGGNPMMSLFYELNIEKGDSVFIDLEKISISESKQIKYPVFKIPNSDRKWNELNFGFLLYKENIKSKAIENNIEGFRASKWDSKKKYFNATELLDSLKENNLISNDFYADKKINQKLKFVTSKVRDARRQNKNLDIKNLGIDLNDEKLLSNKEYISYLRAIVLFQYFNKEKRVPFTAQFDFINNNETFLNSNTKLILLDSYLKSIFFVEKMSFEKYLTEFNNLNTNEAIKNKWVLVVNAQKLNTDKLNKANRSVGVLTNLVNDNELTFEEVLAYHKGKILLVDFWASWCSPCRQEMPYLKNIKVKFNENEFQIIEISIDKDYSAWVRASKLENLIDEENNFIITNWKKTNLYKNYNIKTIPRYLLFDRDGKIIDDDAPRPSEKKLEKLIKASM